MSTPAFRPATAMVFAAGLGTRMRPVTDTMPKPLVEVGGRALIDHMLDRLAEAKVGTAVVNVHYKPEQIVRHVAARREPRIVISDESDRLLDQGGGIIKARETLGRAPFLICNTDALWIEGGRGNLDRLTDAGDWWRILHDGPQDAYALPDDDRDFVRAAFDLLPPAPWGHDTFKAWMDQVKAATGRKGKALFLPIRLAITGRPSGPELADLLPLLGPEGMQARRP